MSGDESVATIRVLLVVGDRHGRNLLLQAIDAPSIWTTVAASPGEARTLLNANRYDLVIVTNLGIPPWLAIEVVPEDRPYEAMFISGHWDDQITDECKRRGLHPVRVPDDLNILPGEISKIVSKIRQAGANAAGQQPGVTVGAARDVGPEVLEFLFGAMKIDERWSVREPRAFAWWGHRLVQRVWAEPGRASHDHHVVSLHAATAVLRDVRDTPDMRARLATTNRSMSLGALTWSPESQRIVLHSAACFHAGNLPWLQPLFLAAVGLQVADAHIKADRLARVLGGEPDVSAHPRSGPRRDPDDILNVIAAVISPVGADASPWTEADFKTTAEMRPRPWVLATADASGMTAEFSFAGDLPAGIAGGPETALLTVSSTDRHPQLGSGLLLRLQLPFNLSKEKGSDVAWMLNVLEATEETNTHALGAWCLGSAPLVHPDANPVTFVSFIPAAAYRKGLLDVLSIEMAIRTRWVARTLLGDGATKARTPTEIDEALRRARLPEHLDKLRHALHVGEVATRVEPADRASEVAKLSEPSTTGPTVGQIQCWACRAPLAVTADTRGKKVKCPRCGTKQALPQ
jgi:hypothetical protein